MECLPKAPSWMPQAKLLSWLGRAGRDFLVGCDGNLGCTCRALELQRGCRIQSGLSTASTALGMDSFPGQSRGCWGTNPALRVRWEQCWGELGWLFQGLQEVCV